MHEFDEQLKNVKSKENAKPQNEHQPDQHKHAINIISFFKSRFLSLSYYKNNAVYFATILVYFLLSILFVLIQLLVFFPTAMWYVQMARAAGILLNFNSCLVIMLVLRRLTSWMRDTLIGSYFSVFDQFIQFHKMIGVWIFILSFLHTLGQCINAYYKSVELDGSDKDLGNYGEVLFGTALGLGLAGPIAMPTGWILLLILCVMVFFAMPFIRRKGYFQLFYITHWLHYIYYLLLILHCQNFWKWFIGPFILIFIERVYNRFRKFSKGYGKTYIKDVNLLSSQVTHLVIKRPKGFKFQSGDYMFIKIPKIARNEWHPFTISSAPELKDELWLHVRSLGNWTKKVNEYFSNFEAVLKMQTKYFDNKIPHDDIVLDGIKRIESKPKLEKTKSNYLINTELKNQKNTDVLSRELNIQNKISNVWTDILLDGPYGTASRRVFDSEHAVLLAGGIGVTPFASILQSLCFQYLISLKTCQKCNHQWYDKIEQKSLKKVDFIWVNRNFAEFEWFLELLSEIELQQRQINDRPFIQIHLYMTSAKLKQSIKIHDQEKINDMKNKNMLREVLDEKNSDFGLKLIPGRPNLEKIFQKIKEEKIGQVDAFFCGAPIFGKQIKKECSKFKFNFSQENF